LQELGVDLFLTSCAFVVACLCKQTASTYVPVQICINVAAAAAFDAAHLALG
jgi:hypothetical protein